MPRLVGTSSEGNSSDSGTTSEASSNGSSDKSSGSSRGNRSVSEGSGNSGSDESDSSSAAHRKQAEELGRLKRVARTSKARAAALVAKATRRVAKSAGAVITAKEHPASAFKSDLRHKCSLNQPGSHSQTDRKRRLRLLVSFLRAWGASLMRFVTSIHASENSQVDHVITSTIIDDCNMRLSSEAPEEHRWKSSQVCCVMNAVQTFTVCYGVGGQAARAGSQCHKSFFVHTPLVVLPKSDTTTIFRELLSRLLLFCGSISDRFGKFGVGSRLAQAIPIQVTTICFDSLATNLSVLKQLRALVYEKHSGFGSQPPTWCLMMAIPCLIHQLALSRRSLLNGFASVGYWSTVVRLAHLMEVSNFRRQFRRAMLAVIAENYSYVPVASWPSGFRQWADQRNEACGRIASDSSRYNKRRLELHNELAKYDNGPCDSTKFVHWCKGDCCPGTSHQAKSRFALVQICKLYSMLFSFGYPVPLLYRWVHCARALQYLKDSLTHFISP